jgi:hypothetical protein
VRYLARLQFVGSIRIELASYEADIVFTSSRTIQAREYDHIAGRISHGKQALQRVMMRAREPHGRIHVYRFVPEGYAGRGENVFIDKSIAADARKMAGAHGDSVSGDARYEFISRTANAKNQEMLNALSHLLRTIDESLKQANLSFAAAFRLACESIIEDYAFLRQKRNALVYRDGAVILHTHAESKTIASAVFAALDPIFRRLKNESKYDALFRQIADQMRRVSRENRATYQALGLDQQVDALLQA